MNNSISGRSPSTGSERVVKIVCGADIKLEPYHWLWRNWLPKQKLTIIAGPSGVSKTTVALSLAAIVTAGGEWPDGTTYPTKGNILVWSGEDGAADTIMPRLIAAGADPKCCRIIDGVAEAGRSMPFDPAQDIPALYDAVKDMGGVSLLLIDPLVSAVAGDMHRANDVRRGLQAVVDFAQAHDCAVIGITHFAKGSAKSDPQDRVIGSQAFAALARMVLVAAKSEDSDQRRIARAKSNIAPDNGGFAYRVDMVRINDDIEASRVTWECALEGTAREILGEVETVESRSNDGHRQLQDFLVQTLEGAGGRVLSATLQEIVQKAGFSWHTAKRVKAAAGIIAKKDGKDGPWTWMLM